ncbi:ABC transporter multidrug efflux pump [Anaerovibrio sp. JC8]|uniref:ATP-binding cassette domain-containing protein n=1 Tax=Anaerovibrio sp. JC8 TaxID=1240085 RepID=UPI000A09F572|nr:ATP-binding cassette domain-containing protein [Anaerovibrio sp. JC8]ORU00640.1 ABC transporter multidrug efflux pump [Anaerovibrio sp. JC8]
MELIVRADNLSKVFTDKKGNVLATALKSINFTLKKGTLTAIVGPDGAGKTTFMRMIAGLITPTSGSLEVLEMNIAGNEQRVQEQISYMPQKFGLYEDLSVEENMSLYARLHGISPDKEGDRFAQLLNMTGLSSFTKRLAGNLSGGMKQKLGLACTLVRSPDLLLLDEPTVGVDPLSRRELWEILGQLVKEEELSVLVNTAYMDEAERCQMVYVLNEGKILAGASPNAIKQLAAGRCYRMTPEDGVPTRVLQGLLLDDKEHVVDAVPEMGRVRFIRQKGADEKYFVENYPYGFIPVSERLEDAFMILLHGDSAQANANSNTSVNVAPLSLNGNFSLSDEIDIEVKDLLRKFGDFIAVDKTSFQVHKGEVFGLLGPNGAGKTTTFRMLCGLLPMSGGFLSVAGVNLRHAQTEARRNIGYVAQKFSLYSDLTVLENLSFFGGVYGLSKKKLTERIQTVLQEFHLTGKENVPAGDLPGGYKQRLSMATALLHEPKILFLDEPTSGIDPLTRRDFWRQITDLSLRGTTIIITTHFMEEAEYCDRIMIQDKGKLLAIGSPEKIRAQQGGQDMSMNEVFISIVESSRKGEHGEEH